MESIKNLKIGFKTSTFSALLILAAGLVAWSQTDSGFTAEGFSRHINYLASEELKGRRTGAPENHLAATYIRNQFAEFGLTLLGNNGFQEFELITGVALGEGNYLIINDETLVTGEDYIPLSFSTNATLQAEMVFVGYGLKFFNDSIQWNDWQDVDLQGKWAVLLRGIPDFLSSSANHNESWDERYKTLLAQDYSAAGVIFVSTSSFDPDDQLISLNYDKNPATASIPVIHIRRKVFDRMAEGYLFSVDQLYHQITQEKKPHPKPLGLIAKASVSLEKIHSTGRNVMAYLPGYDPTLSNEYLLIGAHYDHLGTGGPGSGSRIPETFTVHYGADDNASGVAGILELARVFGTQKNHLRRSIIFVAFDAEELGLIGSRYFVNHPPLDLANIVVMINFDMIGRLKDNAKLSIAGTGTAPEFQAILSELESNHPLQLKLSPDGFGPSDHAVFYARNIPVLFISTGVHTDYHTPGDHPSKINYPGMVQVVSFARDLIDRLANNDNKPTFTSTGTAFRRDHRSSLKVTLGIMPDMTTSDGMGLRVEGVRPGAPAYQGGMKAGDIITAIDGQNISNIYDYMGRLRNLQPGQLISVDILRDGKKEVLIIQL